MNAHPAANAAEIFRTVETLRDEGVSILLVEQQARAALRISDFGYVLETGDIALAGPADVLADDPRVIESYLGATTNDIGSTHGAR